MTSCPSKNISMDPHAVANLLRTLNELSQSSLSLSGAIMGDPAGQIHPMLIQGVEEVSNLAGMALDQAKGLGVQEASIGPLACLSTIRIRGPNFI